MRLNRPLMSILAVCLWTASATVGTGVARAGDPPIDKGGASAGGVDGIDLETVATDTTPGSGPGNQPTPTDSNAGGRTNVPLPPPECILEKWLTGPEMAAYAATFVVPMYPAPPTDWQAHATDLEGRWYQPVCFITVGTVDTIERRVNAFELANPVQWRTTPPPPPAIPVADLVEIVRDSQRLPSLILSTNPDAQTVVGLRTWVWPTGGDFGPVTSRAESGPNWAQVTATPGRLSVTSSDPGAELGSCAAAPAWSPGADDEATDCFVTFRRSSAGRPGQAHTISVAMTWTVRLTTSDGRDEPLASQQVATDVAVPVAQVQSVLR